jgi:hypothetical protein
VTRVELRDTSGADIIDRAGAEPCGTPGRFFNPATVPASRQLRRALPLAISPSAPAGPAKVHAGWARDTGAGLIHYVEAVPVGGAGGGGHPQAAPPPPLRGRSSPQPPPAPLRR